MNVVEVHELTKCYGAKPALDRATWTLEQGRLLGFLGPNGAGKSTNIRILLGLLQSDGGSASIFGLDAWRDSVGIRRRVGYLPGDVRLYPDLNATRHIRFAAAARHIRDTSEADRLATRFELDVTTAARNCSKGMRQKIGLILALFHKPELLILDEPTSALDPLMQQVLYEELRAAADAGRTVLFSSHSLAEVQALCQHVVILRSGRVVASTSIEALRANAPRRLTLRYADGATPALSSRLPEGLTLLDETREDGLIVARWVGAPRGLFAWLATQSLADATLAPPNLDDLFLTYYGSGESREESS
jgi:ABC-2 type transport system ATP-binding protein